MSAASAPAGWTAATPLLAPWVRCRRTAHSPCHTPLTPGTRATFLAHGLCRAGMCYAFVAEFEELHSPLRSAATQGGGAHGQALLSRYSLLEPRALVHTHQPVDWDAEGCAPALPPWLVPHVSRLTRPDRCATSRAAQRRLAPPPRSEARGEPRRGKRVALAAVAALPQPLGHVLVYSLHLEVFTGITGRLQQFAGAGGAACARRTACAVCAGPQRSAECASAARCVATDVLEDARKAGQPARQVVMGDLNTMAHRRAAPRRRLRLCAHSMLPPRALVSQPCARAACAAWRGCRPRTAATSSDG
jgi:hypothetical protein